MCTGYLFCTQLTTIDATRKSKRESSKCPTATTDICRRARLFSPTRFVCSKVLAPDPRSAIISQVNGTHRKTLKSLLSNPVNGNIEWARIESMLKAAGCRVVEGAGSSVTFEFGGRKMTLHRPHPGKEALRYRVSAVREFIERMGIKP